MVCRIEVFERPCVHCFGMSETERTVSPHTVRRGRTRRCPIWSITCVISNRNWRPATEKGDPILSKVPLGRPTCLIPKNYIQKTQNPVLLPGKCLVRGRLQSLLCRRRECTPFTRLPSISCGEGHLGWFFLTPPPWNKVRFYLLFRGVGK